MVSLSHEGSNMLVTIRLFSVSGFPNWNYMWLAIGYSVLAVPYKVKLSGRKYFGE